MPKKKNTLVANATEGKKSTAGGAVVLALGIIGLVGQAVNENPTPADPSQTTAYAGLIVAGLGAIFGTGRKQQ